VIKARPKNTSMTNGNVLHKKMMIENTKKEITTKMTLLSNSCISSLRILGVIKMR
jgi:hypothetical protein